MIVTPSHQVPDRLQDAIAYWLEEQSESSFTLCYRETKIFDGLHQNIKMVSELLNKCSVPSENFSVVPNLLYEYRKKNKLNFVKHLRIKRSEKTQRFDVSMTSFSYLYFIFSLENVVMETSKRCVFSLIFVLKN